MNCPKCGSFLCSVQAEKWALKPRGGKILVYLVGHKCRKCGYAKTEDYQDKIKFLGLLPYCS